MTCIFCKIISKEIPSQVFSESADWIAIRDINPQAPHHLLLVPRRHVANLDAMSGSDAPLLASLFLGAAQLARDIGEAAGGYRVVVNTGSNGGQTVGHLHLHLLAGRPMGWPPG